MKYEIKNNKIIIDDCLDKETVDYVNTTINAFKGHIDSMEWQSKHNIYIVYDYEPFVAQDFNLTITLKKDNVYNEFILFHLTQQLNNIEHLETCLNLTR